MTAKTTLFSYHEILSQVPKDKEQANYMITEILDHKVKTNGVAEVKIQWEDADEKYEPYSDWNLIGPVYEDCQAPVEEGDEDVNLLLMYAKVQKEPKPGFLFAVSKVAGKEAKTLFPNKPEEQTAPWTKKKCASKENKWQTDQNYFDKCPFDHTIFKINHYAQGNRGWHMKEGEKHYELCCNACNILIRNQKKKDHYICTTENAGKCNPNCLNAFCDKCWKMKIQGSKSPHRKCRSYKGRSAQSS